jgi:hypothetical protein
MKLLDLALRNGNVVSENVIRAQEAAVSGRERIRRCAGTTVLFLPHAAAAV